MKGVLYTSVPKCGTHLLLRYFDASGVVHAGPYAATKWDDRFLEVVRGLSPGEYTAWHYHWTPELSQLVWERGSRVVFLYRDPRAQIVSNMHWILKTAEHPWHHYLARHLGTAEERLLALIRGVPPDDVRRFFPADIVFPDARSHHGPRSPRPGGIVSLYGIYLDWLRDPSCLPVRYEDLVGPRGGGDAVRQRETVRRLQLHVEATGKDAEINRIANLLYDPGATTFRNGRADAWRAEMSPAVLAALSAEVRPLFEELGYAA
jgi:sulfotransferase 6B1